MNTRNIFKIVLCLIFLSKRLCLHTPSRKLETELRGLKSELQKAKKNKVKIKQKALDMETELHMKIAALKCKLEDKSKEHERLLNKDVEQLTKSTVARLKRKLLNVKDNIRKKVSFVISLKTSCYKIYIYVLDFLK